MVSSESRFDVKGKFYYFIFLVNESQVRIPVLFLSKNDIIADTIGKLYDLRKNMYLKDFRNNFSVRRNSVYILVNINKTLYRPVTIVCRNVFFEFISKPVKLVFKCRFIFVFVFIYSYYKNSEKSFNFHSPKKSYESNPPKLFGVGTT
jgi:hypothetical protein